MSTITKKFLDQISYEELSLIIELMGEGIAMRDSQVRGHESWEGRNIASKAFTKLCRIKSR